MPLNLMPSTTTDDLLAKLTAEYNRIKEAVEKGGLEGYFLDLLKAQSAELQAIINKIVAKDKKITEDEYNEAYEKLRVSRKRRLEKELSRTKRFFIIAGAIGVLALGFYLYKRFKK